MKEKVGFSHKLRSYMKSGEWKEMEKYDAQFSDDLEHVISDMNACSVHLFAFLKSKIFLAEQRYIIANQLHISRPELINPLNGYLSDYQKRAVLSKVFDDWQLTDKVRTAFENIGSANFSFDGDDGRLVT
jgi:hypothetical protein